MRKDKVHIDLPYWGPRLLCGRASEKKVMLSYTHALPSDLSQATCDVCRKVYKAVRKKWKKYQWKEI